MLTKAQIKLITSLAVKKYRDEHALFVAEGDKLITELLQSALLIKQLYLTEKSKLQHANAEPVSDAEMKKISGLKTPSPSLAVIEIPQHVLNISALKDELVIALDNVQDPGNLGTIIRIADWFGIRHIICSANSADCYSPKTIQATMGAITRVKVYYTDLIKTLNQARQNMPVYGTFLSGEVIYTEKLNTNGIIVMGSEGQGISPEVEACINRKLYIPPYDSGNTSESLNVAVATAIICSEFRRNTIK